MKLEYKVDKENKTINQIINEKFQLSSRLFSKLIREKLIKLNGKSVDTREKASEGDIITIDLDYKENSSNILPKKMDLKIIYEDECMLILNKLAGIAVHPSYEHYENSLANGVKYYFEHKNIYKKIRPVNRLDLNTSGIIIFAKNEYIQENLIRQMAKNIFKKEYIAIVTGRIKKNRGKIDALIARKQDSIIERCISEEGQKAITEYEVMQRAKDYTVVKCKLLTGRTHQIRVHMAYIGYPLLGDTLYGGSTEKINRQALHCYKLEFLHPITNKNMKYEVEVPNDMKQLI